MIHIQEAVSVVLRSCGLAYLRTYFYRTLHGNGKQTLWFTRWTGACDSSRLLRQNSAREGYEQNAQQQRSAGVCLLLSFYAESHVDVCGWVCVFQYAYMGQFTRMHTRSHSHAHTQTQLQNREATRLGYHSSDGIGWRVLCIRSNWLAANWVTVQSSYDTQWDGRQGRLRLGFSSIRPPWIPKSGAMVLLDMHKERGREREKMKGFWLQP